MQIVRVKLPSPCRGICRSFIRQRIRHRGMYSSGRVKCKPCNVWTNYTGCHLFDRSIAVPGTLGWFCNCCNRRVRMRPRTRVCKEMIRERMERSGKRTAY